MLPGMDQRYADLAQHLITAVYDLDELLEIMIYVICPRCGRSHGGCVTLGQVFRSSVFPWAFETWE